MRHPNFARNSTRCSLSLSLSPRFPPPPSLSLSLSLSLSCTHSQIEQVQKGLLLQAQSGLQLADQMRHMFIAQLRIADILGTSTSDNACK